MLLQQGAVNENSLHSALELQDRLRKRRLGEMLSEQSNLSRESVETALATAAKNGYRPPRYRVGDILIEAGLVTRKQVEDIRARQDSEKHKRLGTIMVESGLISEDQLLNALAKKFGLRIIDLDDIQIAPEVMLGIIAQRLVRRLCNQCKVPYHPSSEEYEQLVESYGREYYERHGMPAYDDKLLLQRAKGCPACGGFGYSGRIAIQELLVNSPAIRLAIRQRSGADIIDQVARDEGMVTLRQDGIEKIFHGITDFNQVNIVCL
ncbi:MAG: hypothetical protein RBT64_12935 [Trichloromonas sp.]|nr:hypothetical protein [Trichloromonas sp.]